MKRFKIFAVMVAAPLILTAQNAPKSLQECIAIGLEHNYDILIARNTQSQDENNFSRGNAGQLPTIDLGASYSGSLNDNDYTYPDGSQKSVRSSYNDNINLGINLSWSIFEGFALQTNYRRLGELSAAGELETRATLQQLVADISSEYYNLVRQRIRLSNLQTTLSLSQERLRIVEESYNIGAASGLDFQQAQVDYNADNSALIAQKEVVAASQIDLNRMMAVDDLEQTIVAADSMIVPNSSLDRDQLWQSVMQNNISLLLAASDGRLSQLDYRRVAARRYPYLRLTASYGYRHYNYQNSTYQSQDQLGPSAGITAGVTIFDGMNRRREERNARLAMHNAQLTIDKIENQLRADMANLWMAYRNNLELWEIEKDNLLVAGRNFEIAMERYRLRELSGIELREAQLSLLNSEERLSTAEYNIKLCEISLMQLSGRILAD